MVVRISRPDDRFEALDSASRFSNSTNLVFEAFGRHWHLRAMTYEDVGASVDRAAAKVDRIVRQAVDLAASLCGQQRRPAEIVAMQADDHLVRKRAGIAHLTQVLLEIVLGRTDLWCPRGGIDISPIQL